MAQQVVTVIGGTGFVGRYVVKLLAAAGYTVRVISRKPNAAQHLKTAGNVGQIVLTYGDLANPKSLVGQIEDSYAIVNLVGVLFEDGKQNFAALHAHGPEKLAQMASAAGVQRFVQMSALGTDKGSGSEYAHQKKLGENAVLAAFPTATILRPSVIFGPEDDFFNQFAAMPCLPSIGGGGMRFQPVYVGDVAQAVEACLRQPESMGQIYELGGPNTYTFREIIDYVRSLTGKWQPVMPVPMGIAPLVGLVGELAYKANPLRGFIGLRKPPITRDQVKLLRQDNIVSSGAMTFTQLGISPTAIEIIVPEYLARYRRKAAA